MLSMTIFPARLSCQDPQGLEPYLEQWHPPRNLCRTSTRPGTLHTVLISMGTTLGGCSFMSWTLERQPGVTSEQAHPHPPAFPGESLGSYLRRVSLMSCGRDMWHQCLSPGPGQPPPEGPPKPQTCPPHTHMHTWSETAPGPSLACLQMDTLRSLGCGQPHRSSPILSICLEGTGYLAAGSLANSLECPWVLGTSRVGSQPPGDKGWLHSS